VIKNKIIYIKVLFFTKMFAPTTNRLLQRLIVSGTRVPNTFYFRFGDEQYYLNDLLVGISK